MFSCRKCTFIGFTWVVHFFLQSPVLDVVGVGLADGRIILHNLRTDVQVSSFSHSTVDAGMGSGAVTSVAFSSDLLSGAMMATATDGGALALWSLAGHTLIALLPAAHEAAVNLTAFLPRQSALLTVGADNAIRVWQLDKMGGLPRLLRSRCGHKAPPTLIRFYGGATVASLASGADAAGCEIVSAGADRSLRLVHAALDRQNCELSQGPLVSRAAEQGVHPNALRLPHIVALAASDRRHARWADVVTAHAGDSRGYLWSWDSKRLEDRVLQLPDVSESVTSVCISACGHFAILGGACGSVIKFNLQSAARRGSFPRTDNGIHVEKMTSKGSKRPRPFAADPLPPPDRNVGKYPPGASAATVAPKAVDSIDVALAKIAGIIVRVQKPRVVALSQGPANAARHAHAISGVAVDGLNRTLLSADASGLLLFWNFESHSLLGRAHLPCGVTAVVIQVCLFLFRSMLRTLSISFFSHHVCLQRDSNLAALVCDDFVVRVVDVGTRRLVRRLTGHCNRVTDAAFSPDGRWLATSSLDRSLRVFDLPTGRCIDWLAFDAAPVSLAWAPTGEYLATAHVGSMGVSLWASRSHFGGVLLEDVSSASMSRFDLPAARLERENDGGAAGVSVDTDADTCSKMQSLRPSPLKTAGDMCIYRSADTIPVVVKTGCRLTLSGLPSSCWTNLSKLDLIMQRNKPTQPPTKPAVAPFFLPTSTGLAPSFVIPALTDEGDVAGKVGSGVIPPAEQVACAARAFGMHQSPLSDALRSLEKAHHLSPDLFNCSASAAACDAISELLVSMTPPVIDSAFRSLCLGPHDDIGVALLTTALVYFEREIQARQRRFELNHAQLNLLLVLHQQTISEFPTLGSKCCKLALAIRDDAALLHGLLDRALSVVLGVLDV
jgi:U3 small nucleolar RNA-associated protein 21